MTLLMDYKEIQLKQIYDYNTFPITTLDHASNLVYMLGISTHNNNSFNKKLSELVKRNVLEKVYDFTENGYREGLYNFINFTDRAQISFQGIDHMGLEVFYSYQE